MAEESFTPEKKQNEDDRAYEIMPEEAPYEDGFNLRTVIAALFVGFIMLPGAIYLGLVTGQTMAGAAQWVTLILFIEIAKRSFVNLKTQEIILIYWVAGGLVMMGGKLGTGANLFGGPFGGKIWDQYLIQSPQADGLAQYIPSWLTPPRGSEALLDRSFFHRDWLVPIAVLVGYIGLFQINSLSLGYVLFRVTSDIERLQFPMAPVQAGGATALAETSGKKEGWRWRMFSIGSFIGIIWG
ncbi:MAG: peptide transporter, partial [Candidatus Latescibacteria bacterium]|nr:peptide transporter [Candidatus Latescibacterota bacterium]